jgi:hypothetical protein
VSLTRKIVSSLLEADPHRLMRASLPWLGVMKAFRAALKRLGTNVEEVECVNCGETLYGNIRKYHLRFVPHQNPNTNWSDEYTRIDREIKNALRTKCDRLNLNLIYCSTKWFWFDNGNTRRFDVYAQVAKAFK